LPKQTIVITVSAQDILVQGRKVATVDEALNASGDVIDALQAELAHQARRARGTPDAGAREVTIMGDKEIPYRLLKKIMVTCARAAYDNISLAVLKKEQQG
jgi:biopolymer transport protein TolR